MSAITKIYKHVTLDGKEHETREAALGHISDRIHEKIHDIISKMSKELSGGGIRHTEQLKMVELFYERRWELYDVMGLDDPDFDDPNDNNCQFPEDR